jgi:uncharacterized protein YyaL (SSP411 family)
MNHLKGSGSLYLQQHADNPVHWWPWCEEAWIYAEKTQKPVIISIGYSACHWCHVMEKEVFEKQDSADLMNAHFISIKVDREEHPHVDQLYMNAVQLMGKQGGWPLNVICLPDGRPVFGGSYFPLQQWIRLLLDVKNIMLEQRDKVESYANEMHEALLALEAQYTASNETQKVNFQKLENWAKSQDLILGGGRFSPKFPMPCIINLGLKLGPESNPTFHTWSLTTLSQMSKGGILDVVGGGFCRYSIDAHWHIPHFEKMLYDNAQLLYSYAIAYNQTGRLEYIETIQRVSDWLNTEMKNKGGVYYSSIDADSEGEEGKFYAWSHQELLEAAGVHTPILSQFFGFNQFSMWEEGKNVLRTVYSDESFSQEESLDLSTWKEIKQQFLNQLKEKRKTRIHPSIDYKILTSWNAQLVLGWIQCGRLIHPNYFVFALETLESMIAHLKENGRWTSGRIENNTYSFCLFDALAWTQKALIESYFTWEKQEYLDEALEILKIANAEYLDASTELYFMSNKKDSFMKTKETVDQVIPSSNAIWAENLYWLGVIYGDVNYIEKSLQMISTISDINDEISSHSQWIQSLLLHQNQSAIILGFHTKENWKETIPIHHRGLGIPNPNLPIWKNKNSSQESYYVCNATSCSPPVSNITLLD